MRRKAVGLAAGICVALLMTGAPASADPATRRSGDLVYTEHLFLLAINETRAEHGIGRVSLDVGLLGAARFHSDDMVQRDYFKHGALWWRRLERFGIDRGAVGEILAWDAQLDGSVPMLVQMWLQSPEHRAVLLSPVYRCVGIGVAVGSFRGFPNAVVVTADFWSV
jgi:uncharacterized protein YkwD